MTAGEAPVAGPEPGGLHLSRRRFDEHHVRVGQCGPDRLGPVHVGLDEDVVAGREVLLDRRAGCALQVAVDLEPLEQCALVSERLELVGGDEVVVAPLDLVRAAGARLVTDDGEPRHARTASSSR